MFILPEDISAPVKVHLQKMQLVDGDYDNGGAYWGSGTLYVAHADNVEIVIRAGSRDLAKQEVRALLPNASFYR